MLDNVQDVNKPLVCALQLIREKTPRSFFFSDLSADPARFHIKEEKKKPRLYRPHISLSSPGEWMVFTN